MQPSSTPISRLITLLRFARLLAGLVILFPGFNYLPHPALDPATSPISQSQLQVDFREFVPNRSLQAAVLESLQARPPELLPGTQLAITSAHEEAGWWLGSVASLDGPGCAKQLVGSEGCTGLLLGNMDEQGHWRVGISGTLDFSLLLEDAPETFIAPAAHAGMDLLSSRLMAPSGQKVEYRFPWESGIWQYLDGWHQGAVDISATNGNRNVLSAADGVITYICRGTLSMNIGVRDAAGTTVHYFHLDRSQQYPGIKEGKRVTRGQMLGVLQRGTWEFDGCGYASQAAGSAHLHWGIPTNRSFTADGWTITFPDPAWRRPGDSRYPGHRLKSTNGALINRDILFEIDPPETGGWPYLLSISDDRVQRVLVDGRVEFWPQSAGCYAFWYMTSPGSHHVTIWFEERGEGVPGIRFTPWPAAQVQELSCAGDPVGPPTAWHTKPLEVGQNPFWELPYLVVISDDRIRQVQVDGEVSFSPAASGCPAFWFHATPGSHTLAYEYELRGKGWPGVSVYPWPLNGIQPPECAVPLPDPKPVNLSIAGEPACSENPDAFESDADPVLSTWIGTGETQLHNLAAPDDQDWFQFETTAGSMYALQTSGAGKAVDTLLSIFAADGVTLLESNDDNGRSLGSRLDWTAPTSGTYYLRVRRWNPASPNCETAYWLSLQDRSIYLPAIIK